ncbi:MAG: S1C family serine protease [Vicinamibacterales bacterium]
MTQDTTLLQFSHQLADVAESVGRSVVQVIGHRRPGSGVVYADGAVLTTARALGRDEGLQVRRPDGTAVDAELAGWDPTTNLVVVRVGGLDLPPLVPSQTPARVGHIGMALARSWSNALTVSGGLVSVIGGPLTTGRRRAIEQVIRTSAPMHDGFSGGAFVDAAGALLGVATAAKIRGLGVVIPAPIAWKTAAILLEHGSIKRGYLGIAAQPVTLPVDQRPAADRARALLVVSVNDGSPAAAAGVLVGDVIVEFDGRAVESPEDLLDVLLARPIGQRLTLRLVRGGTPLDVAATVGERP